MKVLVIPSIREDSLSKFLKAWREFGDWDEIVLVEDNPTRTFKVENSKWPIHHYSWKEINDILKERSWIISKRDSAIRCFGFYIAARGLDAEYILTLDDDCYPNEEYICYSHMMNIVHNAWIESADMRTRGIPYDNKGVRELSVCNMGLWDNVPDLDAIQSFNNPELANGGYKAPQFNRIVPKNQYIPFCGMNVFFKADFAPALYFPLMGEGYPYRRFDDIWAGIIFKKIIDHLGYQMSYGQPAIVHTRASNKYTNLIKEAEGIKMNEIFWQKIDSVSLNNCTDIPSCLIRIGSYLIKEEDTYLKTLGTALELWASLWI